MLALRLFKNRYFIFQRHDIQQLLAEELRKIKALKKLYNTLVHKGKGSDGTYKTSRLHREYGGGEGTRIDIVIFSEDDVKKINDPNLTISKKYLDPDFAFELGTEKTTDIKKHLANDIIKLNNVKNTGYVIHIYKDRTKSATGTGRRNNTVEKIKSNFKIVFKNNECPNVNIKKLAILLSPFKDQTLTKGKCEIFNGSRWEKVNIAVESALRKKIIDQLK